MKRIKLLLGSASILVLTSVFATQVKAQDVTGSISFFGSSSVSGSSGSGLTLVNFGNDWHYIAGTGTYNAILPYTSAAFNGFSFTGDGTAAMLTAPDSPLWSITYSGITYTFDLMSLSSGHTQTDSMAFTGAGILHATGYNDTAGSFSLSGTGTNYSFQLTFDSNTAVPEPSTMALLGMSVLAGGIFIYRRRKLATA